MGQLHTIKQIPLGWFTLFLAYFYLLAGCGMQKAANEAFDLLAVPPHFPPCFSIHTPVSFRTPDQTFRLHVVWSVQYDQQIHFIVKGPLGIEVIRGLIDKKGVTLLDKLHRTVYQWDYKRIKADYAIDGNYLFVQSLLLGRVYNPIKPKKGPLIPNGAGPSVTYTYDECTDEVSSVHLIDKKQGNRLSLFYQYKMVTDRLLLSGIKIGFALRDKRDKKKLYKGRIILHKFRCKKLKKPNIRLKIPAHYLRK